MIAVGAVTFVLMFVKELSGGYDLLFLYSVPASIAISVFPIEPVLLFYGKFANLPLVSAIATAGTVIAGYLDHRVFVPVLNHQRVTGYKKSRIYRRPAEWFSRYPFAVLVAIGVSPFPMWPLKILAFSIHYPLSRYLAAIAISRFPKFLVIAWLGMVLRVPNWVLVAIVVVIFSAYGVKVVPRVLRRATTGTTKTTRTTTIADD